MTKLLGFTLLSILVLSGLTIANGAIFNNTYDYGYDYKMPEAPIDIDGFVGEPVQDENFPNIPDQVLDNVEHNVERNNRDILLEELLLHEVNPDTLDPHISKLNDLSFFPFCHVEDPDAIN